MPSTKDIDFHIRLLDSPNNKAALEALANSVRTASRTMEQSIAAIGRAAQTETNRIAASTRSFATAIAGAGGSVSLGGGATSSGTTPQPSRVTPQSFPSGGSASEGGGVTPQPSRVTPPTSPTVPQSIPTGLPTSFRDEVADEAKLAGEEAAKSLRGSFSKTIATLGGLSDADMRTLLNADDNEVLRLGESVGTAYRDGIRKSLSSSLGLDAGASAELFGAQGGAGLKQQQAEYAAETQRVSATLQEQIKVIGELDKRGEETAKKLSSSFRDITAKSEEAASGLGQMASGIAFLFADSENAKELVNTILAIKGSADVFLGGIKALSGGAQIFSLLTDRSKLLGEQQAIAAERTRATSQAAATYVTWLERENIELRDAVGGNQAHADMLRRVATEANAAAAAEARLAAARNSVQGRAGGLGQTLVGSLPDQITPGQSAPVRGGLSGRLGSLGRGLGGLGRGAASVIGGSAIASATGGGVTGLVGSLGLDALLSGGLGLGGAATVTTAPVVGGGAAAATGAAGAAGAGALASVTALAAPAAAAAAALGSIALVGKQVEETFSGTATQVGSLTDTIASTQASMTSWVLGITGTSGIASAIGDLVGNFGVVSSTLGDFDVVGLSTLGAFGDLAKSTNELKEAQERAAKFAQQSIQEALTGKLEVLQRTSDRDGADVQRGNTQTLRDLAVDSASLTKLEAATRARLDATRELSAEEAKIAEFSKGILKNEDVRLDVLQAANAASMRLVDAEKQQIAALREEADIRRSISEDSIASAQRRLGLLDGEAKKIQDIGKAAENSLLSAAEKFARLTDAQQKEAVRAQQIAQRGGKLTDKQQDLLSSIGTAGATDAVRRQNLDEARRKGFFENFGGSEQQLARTAESSRQGGQQRELAVAVQGLHALIAKAGADGRVSLSERRDILWARQGIGELRQQQDIENRGVVGDRRRALGFSSEQNVRDAQRLGVNAGQQNRLAVEISRNVQLQVTITRQEADLDRKIQESIARALRANAGRDAQIRQQQLQKDQAAQTQKFNELAQQKNSIPT